MGDKFETLHGDYADHVKAAVESENWLGQSAIGFKTQADVTQEEYGAARDEAWAVADLLDEAYDTLTGLQNRLTDVRDDAVQAGMHVDSYGRCSVDYSKLEADEAKLYQSNQLVRQELEDSWTGKISDAVKAIQDADENVKLALTVDPDDLPADLKGLRDGFNGSLPGDVGEVNASRADELYAKIADGGELSTAEREELNFLMEQNEDDPEFSRTLLTSVGGPDGLIKLHNEITDRAYYEQVDQKKYFLDLDVHLANTLKTATTVDDVNTKADQDFYDEWREDLREVGGNLYDAQVVERQGNDGARGYQSIVTLMQNSSGYDPQFLHDLADDIRAAEDPGQGGDPDIWDLDGNYAGDRDKDGTFTQERSGWFANDPYDGVLGIMANDPDTATAYFDPGSEQGKERLTYLQTERDWNVVNAYEGAKVTYTVEDKADFDNRNGFGAALEAAMTGNVPGTPAPENYQDHTEAQTRVLEEVVKSYAGFSAVDKTAIPENLRQDFANALTYYPTDLHDILGVDGDFSGDYISTEPNDVNVDRTTMIQFIRGISEDGTAFRTIHDSQMGIVAAGISGLDAQDLEQGSREARGVAQTSGQVMGALDYIRADVLGSHRDDEIAQNNWSKTYAYHVAGAPVTNLPIIGDTFQRLIDIGAGQSVENLNQEVANKTTEELIRNYVRDGYPRLESMFMAQSDQVGILGKDASDSDKPFQQDVLAEAKSEYSAAIGDAQGSTGGNA
ncbi:hypothetical protein JJV70_05245 [Streptomyces sp. JJ66]|uniref:DUF6571 family protein n=1 Tax=Streptomyces sp. JJ66 TaxID=2803843 RepID=UPI001C56A6BB|nr:DUF6571 family protein [Streptomyces sp. JJ66]MBW1601522.1 hypothetical protein [Streptomyces sp. JJ66]